MTKDIKEKTFDELTPEDMKNVKIQFAPGCFDHFDGTQEELDELMNQIKEMFASGEAQKMAVPLDLDNLDEEDAELFEHLSNMSSQGRTLQ